MRRLLVISDLYLDHAMGAAPGSDAYPRLPALCELLRLGSRVDARESAGRAGDWRTGLASDLGVMPLADAAPATVASSAVPGIAAGSPVCLAEPVHLVAGMASVHLHPSGLVSLDERELTQLQGGFEREFGTPSVRLHRVGNGLLLESPAAAAASAPDPARLLGSVLEISRMPEGRQRELRLLGVEIEMWLSGHAMNRDRESRGELPVTALWFWGGGAGTLPADVTIDSQWEQACGSDPWLLGCWKNLMDLEVVPASHWDDVRHPSAVVVTSAARSEHRARANAAGLPLLESRWFEPALRDLRDGKMTSLALRIGGQRWNLGSRSGSRWWRRTRPWWQVIAA